MLDSYARNTVQPVIEQTAKGLHKLGCSANTVTWIAMLLGVSSGVAYVWHWPLFAIILLWVSGFLDTVDGTIARMEQPTPWGNVLDITFDRVVEGAIVVSLILAHREYAIPLVLVLAAILVVVTSFLVVGIVVENNGIKGFHYNAGLLERTEAFLFFTAMMAFPAFIGIIAYIFFGLLVVTAIKHLYDAGRQIGRA